MGVCELHVDRVSVNLQADAPVLRQAICGGVELGHDLEQGDLRCAAQRFASAGAAQTQHDDVASGVTLHIGLAMAHFAAPDLRRGA